MTPVLALVCTMAIAGGVAPQAAAQRPADAEAISLLGRPLTAPVLPEETRQKLEAELAEARRVFDRDPADADAIIWLGRRTAYLGRYRDAIAIFTDGIARHPNDARLYRHRGHRYITVRELDRAIDDFRHAAALVEGQPDEIEPDGQPNPRNIPTSTLQFNVWYHLGLAHYLQGDFGRGLDAWRNCLAVSGNPDAQVATRYWLYLTLRRLDRPAEAHRVLEPVHAGMDIIENGSYHRLLLLFKGDVSPDALLGSEASGLDAATLGYGVGVWHLIEGREAQAREAFRRVLEGSQWAAFGYIAAEAEVAGGGGRNAAGRMERLPSSACAGPGHRASSAPTTATSTVTWMPTSHTNWRATR